MKGRERATLIGATKGKPPVLDANELRPHESHETHHAKLEYYIAKKIGEDLVRHYPGREWCVNVDCRNAMVVISCQSVSLTKGYHLPMRRDTISDLQVRARKAAGEILERYGVSRGRLINPDTLEAMPRSGRDEVIVKSAADTAPEPMK